MVDRCKVTTSNVFPKIVQLHRWGVQILLGKFASSSHICILKLLRQPFLQKIKNNFWKFSINIVLSVKSLWFCSSWWYGYDVKFLQWGESWIHCQHGYKFLYSMVLYIWGDLFLHFFSEVDISYLSKYVVIWFLLTFEDWNWTQFHQRPEKRASWGCLHLPCMPVRYFL